MCMREGLLVAFGVSTRSGHSVQLWGKPKAKCSMKVILGGDLTKVSLRDWSDGTVGRKLVVWVAGPDWIPGTPQDPLSPGRSEH